MITRPIVVGADGSEQSLRAVEWAAGEAERRRLPLRIVSVPAMPPGMRANEPAATVANALRKIAGRAANELLMPRLEATGVRNRAFTLTRS